MGEGKKILGICLAKMQDRVRTEYLNAINKAAVIEGWKTVAYNSFRDFRKSDRSLEGSKAIFKFACYDKLDAVIVFPESINNSSVTNELIESVKLTGKPIISIGSKKEGCFSIVRDYEDGYRDMLNHIIIEHNARDLFFVAGFKFDDERSTNRLNIYKKVLEDNGIGFNEKKICYGDYKDEVINGELDKLFSGSSIPQAIVCIDDKTAMVVCDKMSEYDLKSPDDIIVTGFGGIPAAYYYHPSITSCSDDVDEFAKIVIQAAKDAMDGKKPAVYPDMFKARIRRSCGCDMRSYLSAGRRDYDLEAAKAAGIFVPENADPSKGKSKPSADDVTFGDGTTGQKDPADGKTVSDSDNLEKMLPADHDKIYSEYADTVYMPQAETEGRGGTEGREWAERRDQAEDKSEAEGKGWTEGRSDTEGQVGTGELSGTKEEPLYDERTLNDFAVSNPKLADTKMGTYDVTYGSGRQIDSEGSEPENGYADLNGGIRGKGNDASGSIAGKGNNAYGDGQGYAKIYPSDIFKNPGEDKESIRKAAVDIIAAAKKEESSCEYTGQETGQTGHGGQAGRLSEHADREPGHEETSEVDKAAKRAMEVADDKRCVGGHSEEKFRSGNHVAYLYKELDEIERREDSLLAWLDRMLELTNLGDICNEISKRLPSGSELYIYSDLLESNFDLEAFGIDHSEEKVKQGKGHLGRQKLTKITSAADSVSKSAQHDKNGAADYEDANDIELDNGFENDFDEVYASDIVRSYAESEPDGCMLVISPAFIGSFVCGCLTIKTKTPSEIRSKVKLLNVGLNIIFRFLGNQNRQQRMLYNIENSIYVSSMTGLPNLKGSTRWFEGFAEESENHQKKLSISVFTMPRYTYIYENYGLNEIEDAVRLVVEKLRNSCRKTSFLGQFAEGEFIVIDLETEEKEKTPYADELFDRFNKQMEVYNRSSTKEYYLEVNFGTATVEEGWDSSLENLVRMAMSDMYLRRLRQGKSTPVIKDRTFDREYFTTFELLVDRNLFRYHFQPIVDASTGEIFAYEALMRTGGGISMTPLDVLEIAKNANRLYDIEKATIFNVLRLFEENRELFGDRKLFINTLPGYFLTDKDKKEVIEKYGKYFDSVVFEVTETDTVTDEEIDKLRQPGKNGETPGVAVDDYGTGHSNIVNLLRYAPQIIKIDHYLVSNIQDDSNKQMFVKNTIEFAAANGMKVLAEGVESFDELKTVIEYGVDYIQGYYTAHPTQEIMQQIPHNIRNEIVAESIKVSRYDNNNLTYNVKAGETVRLLDLALKKYTVLNILGGKVKLIGDPDNVLDMVIRTADNKKHEIIFENVNLRGVLETTVQLGKNTETALHISGECTLNKDGIYVPAGSRLTVSGEGNLHIITSRNLSVGIGSNCNEPHGDISFDMTGSVKIVANGDKVAGIGGGRCEGSRIRLINGNFDISAKAIHAVAIGSDSGDTDIYIGRTANCRLKSDGNDSIALGSISGRSEIVCRGRLDVIGDGEKTVGIGSINGYTKTDLLSNDISVVLHSYCGIGIGSLTGTADVKLEDANTDIYAEGTQINGIGGGEDTAKVNVVGGNIKVEILAGIPRSFGCQKGYVSLHYGSITCLHDTDVAVVNEHMQKVQPRRIDNGVVFEV